MGRTAILGSGKIQHFPHCAEQILTFCHFFSFQAEVSGEVCRAVWNTADERPTNFSALTSTPGSRLDRDQRFATTPKFRQLRAVFTPASWRNHGGGFLRQFFGEPAIGGADWGVIQPAP